MNAHSKERYGRQVLRLFRSTVESGLRQSPFDASSREGFLDWQRHARKILAQILGEMPREKAPFRLRRKLVARTKNYMQERIVYQTRPGLEVPAWLFTPRNAAYSAPAVLCLHGHSTGGKDETIDPKSIYHGFALQFARRGCVVLCPDQIGFGERKLPEDKVTYGVLTHGLNMLGHTLIGWRYWDLSRALDLLSGMPTVDRARIGVMGLSLGGEMAMFLAAMQTRIRAACVCGYLTSHRSTFLDRAHCTCGHLRDLARHFEHADLAALIAPRPLFLEAGLRDEQFPAKDAKAIVKELRTAYKLFGKPAHALGMEVHAGAHEISGCKSIPWMLDHLGPDGPRRRSRDSARSTAAPAR